MDNNEVDEKLIQWNDIFEELVIDAKTLINDLWESLHYILIFGVLLILLGGANVTATILLERGTRFIALGFIIFFSCASLGIIQIGKWYSLRKRYIRIHSLQQEMESK